MVHLFLKIGILLLLALGSCGCVSLKGYRDAKARMLYLEYERVNGPMELADTVQIVTEHE